MASAMRSRCAPDAVDRQGDAAESRRLHHLCAATAALCAPFSGKAYVLPRTGQRGIRWSASYAVREVKIYRIGDRN